MVGLPPYPPPHAVDTTVQAQASDAMALPGEEGELTSALRELSALMKGLAEDVVMESPAHRRALLRTSLPACLGAMLEQTYQGEAGTVVEAVQEALRNVARAVARVRVNRNWDRIARFTVILQLSTR